MVGRGGEEIDNATECVDSMKSGTGALENLDRVHGFERDGQVEVVVRGLAVVDAESVEQDEGLLEAAAAQDEIGLAAAGATLLEEDGRVVAEKLERGFGGEFWPLRGSTSTERGDSASGTGTAEPRTTMVSVRTGMAADCGVEGVWAGDDCRPAAKKRKAVTQVILDKGIELISIFTWTALDCKEDLMLS